MTEFDAAYHFPKGFLWGTATASHQVEGNNHNNNWSRWETEPGRIINDEKCGLACDWWGGRWKEDFDRAVETGQNAHRLSIEWSRIQPAQERWDEDALDYYREMLRGLYDRGLSAMVTLHHFTDPLWMADQGGWENPESPVWFEKFVRKAVEALKEYCSTWVTINEPNVYAVSGYIYGQFPPGKKSIKTALNVMVNLTKGHAAAYHTIHEIQKEARVGFAINYRDFVPAKAWFLPDQVAANIQRKTFNNAFPVAAMTGLLDTPFMKTRIPQAVNTQDFLGVNYYSRDLVAFNLTKPSSQFIHNYYPKNPDLSPTGFIANIPEGMYQALKWGLKFKVPMIVTENGVEDHLDTLRPRYLLQHIHQVWRAVNFNWPVKGYFHWSLVDNFEWERGWTQRFGLWGLNPQTQERTRRKSVDLYEAICRENGITTDMVDRFAPEVMQKIFNA
jgi:beta-glucosidase